MKTGKLLRFFPRLTNYTPTDDMAFVGDPPLPNMRPDPAEVAQVHVSVTFTWDQAEGARLVRAWRECGYANVRLGGPAIDRDAPGVFVPGRYLKPGVTITSRGCIRRCPWCHVPRREGGIRLLSIVRGNIVQDNNLLACPRHHVEGVFRMLQAEKRIVFAGGLDARLLEPWHIRWLKSMGRRTRAGLWRWHIKEIWLAADYAGRRVTDRAAELLISAGLSRRHLRCYVLVAWAGDTPAKARARLQAVWDAGLLPFCQFYRGAGEQQRTPQWKELVAEWSRPAAMFASQRVG
jgi:hypothetical protein